MPSRESRYHESPRRRTWAKIALAFAARAWFTTATTCSWLLRPVLNVSTQKPRYCADWARASGTRATAAASDKAAHMRICMEPPGESRGWRLKEMTVGGSLTRAAADLRSAAKPRRPGLDPARGTGS